jgi:hypothetical protein
MNLIETIKSLWSSSVPEPKILDHFEISRPSKKDWRINAIKKASGKHGKPFKAAMDGVPREVMKGGAFKVVGQNLVEVRRIGAKK